MTAGQAWLFAMALATGLLVVTLPATLRLIRPPAAALRQSLVAGATGWAAAFVPAAVGLLALPGGPAAPAGDVAVLIAISAALGVMLAAIGAALIALYRRFGLLTPGQARGTAAAILGCWLVVVGTFWFLGLG